MRSQLAIAQDLSNFVRLESKGTIPSYFLESTINKIEADKKLNNDKSLENNFFSSTRYAIDDLLLSGNILFNEDLSEYVNEVAKYTLKEEIGLYDQLQFYVIKSTEVNAYSTDQGIIFFTTGLLAQIENEAQLAFIIAHESSHFLLNHIREGYKDTREIKREAGKFQTNNHSTILNQLNNYHKENELAADKKGIEIYLKTEYDVTEVFSSFEMLLYSYLPFYDLKFDKTFFDSDILKIPNTYFPDTSNVVSLEDDYDDENHTHPNMETRFQTAEEFIENQSSKGNLKYKISENEFIKIRNLARFEGLNLMLSQREYVKTIYLIYLLKKDFPDNRFLDLCLVKAFYGLAKYKNANRYEEVMEDLENIEGESFILHYFFKEIDQASLNILAYRIAYDLSVKYNQNNLFINYEKEMKKEFAVNSSISSTDLQAISYDSVVVSLDEPSMEFDIDDSLLKLENSDLTKFEKIRIKKRLLELKEIDQEPTNPSSGYFYYGLWDLVSNESFIAELATIRKNEKAKTDAENLATEDVSSTQNDEKGADTKIILVDPHVVNYNFKNDSNREKAERKKIELTSILDKEYPDLGLDKTLIDSKLLDSTSVDEYNELGLMNQWLEEVLYHNDLGMISSSHEHIEVLEKKYGSEHFVFSGLISYKSKQKGKKGHILLGIFCSPCIPFILSDILIPREYFQIIFVTINSTTDQIKYTKSEEIGIAGTPAVIEAYVYDLLYQLKINL